MNVRDVAEQNRQAVHARMWADADKRGKVRLVQKEIAADLGMSVFQMCRIVEQLLEQGRIKKIASGYKNVGVYAVRDPAQFPN